MVDGDTPGTAAFVPGWAGYLDGVWVRGVPGQSTCQVHVVPPAWGPGSDHLEAPWGTRNLVLTLPTATPTQSQLPRLGQGSKHCWETGKERLGKPQAPGSKGTGIQELFSERMGGSRKSRRRFPNTGSFVPSAFTAKRNNIKDKRKSKTTTAEHHILSAGAS